jgi:hypothetical protein
MAFFGLSDITISQEENRSGPLAALFASESGSPLSVTNTFRYPLDIGNYDKGHYMVFHIYQQNNSQYKGIKRSPEQETLRNYKGASKPSTSFASQINSKIDSAVNSFTKGKTLFGKEISTSFGSSSASVSKQNFSKDQYVDSVKDIENKSLLQTTKLTSDSIVLYMPDTVNFDHSQGYGDLQLGNEKGGKAMNVAKSILDSKKEGSAVNKTGDAALVAAAQALQSVAAKGIGEGSATAGAFLALGGVNNPMLEMIYQSPSFREFTYEFLFYPRDEREALEVQNIIERFRFHQAPEVDAGSSGLLLIPPSQFDIQFYYGGKPNPNIPSIGRCVMTNIQVNYAPNGWSAYEMPGENDPRLGRTGMPTAIQMTLSFKETVIITKQAFRTGPGGYKGRELGLTKGAIDKLSSTWKGMTEK